jgi:peptidoglycan/LPS O-acetylase OafA/YrhL
MTFSEEVFRLDTPAIATRYKPGMPPIFCSCDYHRLLYTTQLSGCILFSATLAQDGWRDPSRGAGIMATLVVQPKTFSGSINALRFFAALLIVFAHTGFVPLQYLGAPSAILNLIQARSLITELFFIISGFLITLSLSKRLMARSDFLLRRFARLYPIHLTCFAVLLGTMYIRGQIPWGRELVAQCIMWVTMTHGFFPQSEYLFNSSAWAVTAFMLGYVLIPFFARQPAVSGRRVAAAIVPMWLSIMVPGILIVCALGNHFAYSLDYAVRTANPFATLLAIYVHGFVAPRILEVAVGATLALYVRDCAGSALIGFASRSAVIAGTAVALVAFIEYGSQDGRMLYLMTHGLLLPLLLLLVAGMWSNNGVIEKLLSCAWLQRGGRASLLLYFIHIPVWQVVKFGGSILGLDGGARGYNAALFLLSFVLTLAIAFAFQPSYDSFSRWLAGRLIGWTERSVETWPLRAAHASQ